MHGLGITRAGLFLVGNHSMPTGELHASCLPLRHCRGPVARIVCRIGEFAIAGGIICVDDGAAGFHQDGRR